MQVWDSVVTESTIGCTKCKKQGDICMDDGYEASDYFFGEGWRVTPNHCYCPKCAKKYLKL